MKTIPTIILACLLCGCASTRTKLTRVPTQELVIRHTQCENYLASTSKGWWFKMGPAMPLNFERNPRQDRLKEKEAIETELGRRWIAGDQDAYLPMFGPKGHLPM